MKNNLQSTRNTFSNSFQCKKAPRWLSKLFTFSFWKWKVPPCIFEYRTPWIINNIITRMILLLYNKVWCICAISRVIQCFNVITSPWNCRLEDKEHRHKIHTERQSHLYLYHYITAVRRHCTDWYEIWVFTDHEICYIKIELDLRKFSNGPFSETEKGFWVIPTPGGSQCTGVSPTLSWIWCCATLSPSFDLFFE